MGMVPHARNRPDRARDSCADIYAGSNACQCAYSGLADVFQRHCGSRARIPHPRMGGVLLHVAGAALGILVGLLVVTDPLSGALAFTLLFACFFTVIGLFRLIAAISLRYRSWGWAVFDGLVTLALGVVLWAGMPWSGLWFLGLALGIALLLRGWSDIMFAFAVRSIGHIVALRPAA